MTINTETKIVSATSVAYPTQPQAIFGSPRRIAAINDSQDFVVWISFDGIVDAARLKPAAGFADVGVEFDDLYEKVWVRLDAGVGPAEVQICGEEVGV